MALVRLLAILPWFAVLFGALAAAALFHAGTARTHVGTHAGASAGTAAGVGADAPRRAVHVARRPLPPAIPTDAARSMDVNVKFEERDSFAEAALFPYHPDQVSFRLPRNSHIASCLRLHHTSD